MKKTLIGVTLLLLFVSVKAQDKKYQPNLASLETHKCPEWFEDAKFGVFIDWGLYSVAGWAPINATGATYPDWYLHRMYTDSAFIAYHKKTWGADFERDDFIPLFKAADYKPEDLVKFSKEIGAKYVVPFAKHHDGFCLWPSSYTNRNAFKMGAGRDLIAPMVAACKQYGLKFGFYQSLEEWEYPMKNADGSYSLRLWDGNKKSKIVPYDEKALKGMITGKVPVANYAKDYLIPQTKEFIEKYEPDMLWFDGDWTDDPEAYGSYEMVAWYYNRARKPVAVNDRLGNSRSKSGDFYTSEYGEVIGKPFDLSSGPKHKWEECRGISSNFGYSTLETIDNIVSADELIKMLVNIVANNGNLLLVVNLTGQGTVPPLEKTRLEELGKWLAVNGEAIYATRPWIRPSDGDDIRYTKSKDGKFLYVISLKATAAQIAIADVAVKPGAKITMLGHADKALKWNKAGNGISVSATGGTNHAYVLKVPLM